MIRFENVSVGAVRNLSFTLEAGGAVKILFDSAEQKHPLCAALTGLRRPESGVVVLFGQDIYRLREKDRLAFFQRVGVVPEYGGLISNLKAWENLVLPAWYHRGRAAPDLEREVVTLFGRLGIDEAGLRARMGRLPDQLTLQDRRAVALVRAMLLEPEVLIYDFVFAGLERDAAERMMRLAREFHGARPGRISLYLCPDDATSARLPADRTITLVH
jgi:phospholipid/cholesterol/gamma-HCH transport system ATP-binding protein